MQLLRALSEVCSSRVLNSAEARAKADGIFKSLAKAETFLGLKLLSRPLVLLEQLNITLQSEKLDIEAADRAIDETIRVLGVYREDEFNAAYNAALALTIPGINITGLEPPRQRRLLMRLGGGSINSSEDMIAQYRVTYFAFLDRITTELRQRYSTTGSPDLAIYSKLAGIFKTGAVPSEAKLCPEVKMSALCIEAATFVRRTGCTSVYTAKKVYQELSTVESGL